ncbi:GIY-YIG nuclease family protein [Aliivibrio fischeri]|uniref:GIY-YIG nuclease family protein n=1 Tax=Aliivibrio fischeri TaxID=668 RepID=UPI0009BBE882|nr:GIY-YIG nuclease family protein [Aliivibrio fischeri]
MHKSEPVRLIKDLFNGQKINLPEDAGVYVFWWLGDKDLLMNSNRTQILKGPGDRSVSITFENWWPEFLDYPCLYVGKTTNIKKRLSLHLKRGSKGRLHTIPKSNEKLKAVTTSCQLRYGIEHIFPDHEDPLELIFSSVGFSYITNFSEGNPTVERFFTEDLLIGQYRPWFNIDSER